MLKLATEKIMTERDYKIVKHNDLIQKSRYSLNTQEQKVILYLISKIMPEDDSLKLYEFKIKDFCQICGIDETNGNNYIKLKACIKKLADKSVWITIDDKGTETLIRWIERPYINIASGILKIKIDDLMKPYLLQLKNHFTQYNFLYTLAMKSKYSIRLFEILKSYSNLHKWTVSVDDLKTKLSAETYERYSDFKRKVIDIAIREINEYSDITVSLEFIKDSRKISEICFNIKTKKEITERIKTWAKIESVIDN